MIEKIKVSLKLYLLTLFLDLNRQLFEPFFDPDTDDNRDHLRSVR